MLRLADRRTEVVMDPVSLVVGALAAGASKGLGDTAATAVGDAYRRLKALVAANLKGRRSGELALDEHEADPDTWHAPLAKELAEAGAATDTDILALAERLMALVDPAGANAGKYVVSLAGAKNVQVGDHGTQYNIG